jgi:serine/threonine protein kinase/tetratricopeptide (TPR) repeat protein
VEDFLIESRFVLEARVGRGASGDVHRALDRETGRPVAVKRLLPNREDENALDRFRREAWLLAQINDPHVVRYVAHGVDGEGRPCLVVEWLEGEDLSRRQKRQRLTAAEALDVARQVAAGLAALHDAGIVHRDVKPANIFLVKDGEGGLCAKLIDLGIARTAGESTLTAVGMAVGTPAYMSPEQVRGDERITARADQFSLGVVLFELLAGRRPFTGEDQFAVLAKIVLTEAPRLRELVPAAPPAAEEVLDRLLRKDPIERFPSARVLEEALLGIPSWDAAAAEPAADASDDTPTARPSAALSATFEQRVITALFAGLAPHAGEAERRVFASIAEDQGGACHGTLGRRVIAVFGGARSTGDEAMRAARTALTAAERLPGIQLAIATGRALAGVTGLSGDLIERGARVLEQPGSGIRLDEATARLLADHFVVDGRQLTGVRPAAAAPRTLVGKPTPLVGRDRELATLTSAFAECVSEPVARAVVVSGPAGIGKSRLRYELLAHIGRQEPKPEVLLARGSPIAVDSAFGLLAPAVRRFAGILDGEPAADQWKKLGARVGRRIAAGAAARIGELCSLPPVDAAAPQIRRDAMLSGDLMRAAFIEWLEAECAERPLVIVIEDLHWGDRASVAFLGAALRALPEVPLFVVGLGRPEVHERFPASWITDSALGLRLAPLTAKASERLVRAVLGPSASHDDVQRIVSRAEGNAFYLEELVRAVAEGSADALPDTVLGMVQARLDGLGTETKRVLRAAAVFGQTFWRGGVAALLGENKAALGEALDRLVAAELVARRDTSGFPGEEELVFRHALVREAAYAMIPDDDRRIGHRVAGIWLERAGEVDPAVLAVHFERGADAERAARYHLGAAEKALAGNDFAAALAHAEGASSGGAAGEDGGRARLVQAEAHRWRGEMSQAASAAAEAAERLTPGTGLWFHALREAIAANGRLGRFDAVTRWADATVARAAAEGAAGPQLAALAIAAGQMIYAGNTEQAARLLLEIERLSAAAGKLDPTVAARLHQVRALLADHDHDLEACLGYHQAALDCFERAGDRRGACLTQANLGSILIALGSWEEAEDALRRAHATATRLGLGTIAPLALHNLGAVLMALGRLDEARAAEEEAARAFAAAGDPRLEGASRVYLSRILLASGDAAGAEAEARRVAEATASPAPLRASAQAAMARALLAQKRVAEAVAAAGDAAAALATLGALEDFEALIGLAHAEALFAGGQPEAAKAAIADACRRIHLRAARLGEATRARFLGAVPDNARCLGLAKAWGIA